MKVIENLNLKNYNAYQIESYCSKAYFPESINDFFYLLSNETSDRKIIIGNGNNIILSKDYYEEAFIIINGCFDSIEVEGTVVQAEAGTTLLQLSKVALENDLTGFEIFYDIPSSVGGAVVMNAGSKAGEIKDILLKVQYLDLTDNQIREISKNEISFEYRNSFFQRNPDKIVLKAWFHLKKGYKEEIESLMERIKRERWEKQPREYPNCGSVFKRPPGRFVGPMLDELGLKGYSVGGAKISEKHSGFIVNMGNASGRDILDLIRFAQDKVKEKFRVVLEVEQRII